MPIKYVGVGDSGVNQANSINPVLDGEAAVAAVLSRPSEALRARTEAIRTAVDIEELARTAFSQLSVLSHTSLSVTWDGAWDGVPGAPALGATNSGGINLVGDMIVRPIGSPLTANFAASTFVNGLYNYTVTALVRAYQGGNRISWKAENTGRTTGSAVVVTVYGDTEILDVNGGPQYPAYIVADYLATATLSDLSAAVAANATAAALAAVTYAPADATQLMFSVGVPTRLSGGKDAFQLSISATTMSTFFNAAEANRLQVGDILAISFSSDLSKLTRSADSAPSSSVASAELFNSRVHPELLEYAVPLFAVSRDGVYGMLVGGTRCDAGFASVAGTANWESRLGSTLPGEGASLVGIEDLNGNFTTASVEGALQENWTTHSAFVSALQSTTGAAAVGVADAGSLYASATVEGALQEVGSEAFSSSAALVRRYTHYDGVISGLVPSFNWTGTGLITYTSGQILVDGKVLTVPSFTVGAPASGATLQGSGTAVAAALVYIDINGVPALAQSNVVNPNVLSARGAVLCRVQFSITNLLAVWDARRKIVADTDPSKLVVTPNTTIGTGDVTAYSQFDSFGSAVHWAEHQATTADALHDIHVIGTVATEELGMNATDAGASMVAYGHFGGVGATIPLTLSGDGIFASTLTASVLAPISGAVGISNWFTAASKVKDLRLVNSTFIPSFGGASVNFSGTCTVTNVAADITVGGGDAIVFDGAPVVNSLVCNDGIAGIPTYYMIKITGTAGYYQDIRYEASTAAGSLYITGNSNFITGRVRGSVINVGVNNYMELITHATALVDIDPVIAAEPLVTRTTSNAPVKIFSAATDFNPFGTVLSWNVAAASIPGIDNPNLATLTLGTNITLPLAMYIGSVHIMYLAASAVQVSTKIVQLRNTDPTPTPTAAHVGLSTTLPLVVVSTSTTGALTDPQGLTVYSTTPGLGPFNTFGLDSTVKTDSFYVEVVLNSDSNSAAGAMQFYGISVTGTRLLDTPIPS